MRVHHELYRKGNPKRRTPLRGERRQLQVDLYRMLRRFARPNPTVVNSIPTKNPAPKRPKRYPGKHKIAGFNVVISKAPASAPFSYWLTFPGIKNNRIFGPDNSEPITGTAKEVWEAAVALLPTQGPGRSHSDLPPLPSGHPARAIVKMTAKEKRELAALQAMMPARPRRGEQLRPLEGIIAPGPALERVVTEEGVVLRPKAEVRRTGVTPQKARQLEEEKEFRVFREEELAERAAVTKRRRPSRVAYRASIVPRGVRPKKKPSKRRKALAEDIGGVAAEHWEAQLRAGQTRFGVPPEKIGVGDIVAGDIVAERDTSAAWNFLGLIQFKLRSLLEPTGKVCKPEQSPFDYAPSAEEMERMMARLTIGARTKKAEEALAKTEAELKSAAARRERAAKRRAGRTENPPRKPKVCFPVTPTGNRFEWYTITDSKKWEHLMNLRMVVKAAIDQRLSGANLEANLEQAIRELNAAEAKVVQQLIHDAYARRSEKEQQILRRESRLWGASPGMSREEYLRALGDYPKRHREALQRGEEPPPRPTPHPAGWTPEFPATALTGQVLLEEEEEIPPGIPQWLVDEMEGDPWTREQWEELRVPTRARARAPSGEVALGLELVSRTPSKTYQEEFETGLIPRSQRARIGASPFAPVTSERAAQLLEELSDEEVAKLGARKLYKRLLTPDQQEAFLTGRWARTAAAKDPTVVSARRKVEAIKRRIAEQKAEEEKRKKFRSLEIERAEMGKPLTRQEYIWGPERAAEDKERRREELRDPYRKYEAADEKLWDKIGEAIVEGGITGRQILLIKYKKLADELGKMIEVIGDETPTKRQKEAMLRIQREMLKTENDLKRTKGKGFTFGPFKKTKKTYFGARYGPYIPAKQMTKLLLKLDRIQGATGASDVKVLMAAGVETVPEEERRAKTPIGRVMELAAKRQEADEERLHLINSKKALRAAVTAKKQLKKDADWLRKGMGKKPPKVKVAAEDLERERKKLIKRHNKISNARARTAQLVIYEEMGGRQAGHEEILRRRAKEESKREKERKEGHTFDVGKGAYKIKAAYILDEKAPDPKKPWLWALFAPGSTRKRIMSGYAGTKAAAGQVIARAHKFWENLQRKAIKDDDLATSLEAEYKQAKTYWVTKDGEPTLEAEEGVEERPLDEDAMEALFEKYGVGGYDGLSKEDKRWLKANMPKISEGIAGTLLDRSAELWAAVEAEAGKENQPNKKVLQYLIEESGEFPGAAAVAKIKTDQHLRRMGAGEERILSGRGYKIKVKKRGGDQFQFQVTTSDGRKSTIIRKRGTPKEIESKARAVAGAMMGAEKVAKALRSKNPAASMKRLRNSAAKYFRQTNPGIPREAAEVGTLEDMSTLFRMPADPNEAYKQGFYAGIIKGIDTCGVQNWAKRKKLRKEFERRLVEGLLRFQEEHGVRRTRGRGRAAEPSSSFAMSPDLLAEYEYLYGSE